MNFLSIDNVMFTFYGYNMSYLEFTGTILYLLSVILIALKNMWTWPVGLISVVLYAVLFYQIQLYSDALEQIYYVGACIYGWYWWKRDEQQEQGSFYYSPLTDMLAWMGVLAISTGILVYGMLHIHEALPVLFPVPADYPLLDAFTTALSFIAMYLMARKKIESWVCWIIVDLAGIWLYFVKDVKLLSLLYVILLIIAVKGLLRWHMDALQRGTLCDPEEDQNRWISS